MIYIYIYIAISDSKNERPYWGCSWCQIIVKTQLTSTKIIHADDNKYQRLGSNLSIFYHDNISEEMRSISLEMAVIVWKPSGGQLHPYYNVLFFLFRWSDMSITFHWMKDFHKTWFCKDLTAIKPSVHQDCFS